MMTETVVNVQEAPNNNAANNKPQASGGPLGWIKINVDYFKTVPGLIKVAQFILGIICMSLASPNTTGGISFFIAIASLSFIATIIWIIVYFLGVREALTQINWIFSELINTGIIALLYGVASLVQIIVASTSDYYVFYHHSRGANIAAGVFGLFNTAAYGAGSYFLNLEWQRNRN